MKGNIRLLFDCLTITRLTIGEAVGKLCAMKDRELVYNDMKAFISGHEDIMQVVWDGKCFLEQNCYHDLLLLAAG